MIHILVQQRQNFAILHGLSVGIGQWLILRRLVKKAGWWVLVNALGGWVGGIISGAVLVWLLHKPKILGVDVSRQNLHTSGKY